MLPNISIQVNNGGLGLVPVLEDGVSAMVIQSANPLNTIKTYTADTFEADFPAAFDEANNEQVHFALGQFFGLAGSNAVLRVGMVGQGATNPQILAKAKQIIDVGQGEIRLMAFAFNPANPATFNIADSLGVFCDEVVKPVRDYSRAGFTPISILVEGFGIGSTVESLVAAPNLHGLTHGYMSVVVGTSFLGRAHCANIGQALGWLSNLPVQRNMGRVKSGAPTSAPVYLADTAISVQNAYVDSLNTKGYITYRKFPQKAGYYFTDDPTATAVTDDYSNITSNRVIDKATRLAYAVYVNEILDEIDINPANGRISAAQARYFEQLIDNAINSVMTDAGEITSIETSIDLTQNVLSTGKTCIKLRLISNGYARFIEVDLGLKNPFI